MITDEQREHVTTAGKYLLGRLEKKAEGNEQAYRLCRGDIMILVALIEQELKAASPINDLKRLTTIRGKLGDLFFDSPEMSKEEAQQFR